MADKSSLTFNNNDKITSYQAGSVYSEGGDASLDNGKQRYIDVLNPPAPLVACKGDGVTDDSAALQAILNNALGEVYLGDMSKTYYFGSPLTIDHTRCSLVANGATLNFAGDGIYIQGLIIGGSGIGGNYFQTTALKGLNIINNNSSNTNKGIVFGGTNVGGHNVQIDHCTIQGFYYGTYYGNNAYIIRMDYCSIFHSHYCVYYPSGLTNSGENLTFNRCVLCNSTIGVYNWSAEMHFIGTSIDYITTRFIDVENGASVHFSEGHIEGSNDADYWFYVHGADSNLFIHNSVLALTQTSKTAFPFGWTDTSTNAFIHLRDIQYTAASGGYYNLPTWVTGLGTCTNIMPYTATTLYGQNLGIDGLNYLLNGTFGTANYNEWTVSGGQNPSIDTTAGHTANNALKLTLATAGQWISIYHSVPVAPGQKPRMAFWAKAAFNGSADNFTVLAKYFDASGNALNPQTFTMTFSAAGTNPAGWTLYKIQPYTMAPAGAASCRFYFQQANSTTTSDGLGAAMWFDDIIITVD